jgi:hypothetical protein
VTAADLTISFTVPAMPEEVLEAVLDPRSWWSVGITGDTRTVGDEFEYRYEGLHYSRIRVTRVAPDRVEWLAVDNQLTIVDDHAEWTGTTMSFAIRPAESGTELTFTHHGLTEALACFDSCRRGWTHFVGTSLRELLTTGRGQPAATETAWFSQSAGRASG